MNGQLIARDALGVLTKLGQGGQGIVYRAPKAKTVFAESMVFKEYKSEARTVVDFGVLSAMPVLVEEGLSRPDAEKLISIAAWPCRVVESQSVPVGFVMPAIPTEFVIELTTVKGVSGTVAEFQHLLNDSSVLAARGIIIDDSQRCALLREVASSLAFLHKIGVCVGDISPKNLLFSLSPRVAVYFIDCDAMRVNEESALPQVETPGWEGPASEELATVESDFFKLGLLALRLLAGDQETRNVERLPSDTPSILRQLITDTLNNPPDRRPLAEAWTYVLGHVAEQAPHGRTSPKTSPSHNAEELHVDGWAKVVAGDKRYIGQTGRVVSINSGLVEISLKGAFTAFQFRRDHVIAVEGSPESPANPTTCPEPVAVVRTRETTVSGPAQATSTPIPTTPSGMSANAKFWVAGISVAAVVLVVVILSAGLHSSSQPDLASETTTSSMMQSSPSSASSSSSASPTKPTQAEGANMTIQDYITENKIVESQVNRGDPSAPTLDLPFPPGWSDAGPQTPAWAYGAILFEKPEDPADPPSIIAIVSKLTGNVDPAKVLEYAPGEVQNLSGFELIGGPHQAQLSGFDAVEIGGTYLRDGKKRLIAQKTVVIPGRDGLYVLQMNADALEGQEVAVMDATSIIDEQTIITP